MARSFLSYLFVFAVVGGGLYWHYRVPPSLESTEIMVETPSGIRALNELEEGALLVNFYASWCGPCMQEIPVLKRANALGNFKVVGVTDDASEAIAEVAQRFGVSYPLYRLDRTLDDYGVHSIPTSYLINAEGEVVLSINGVREWDSPEFQRTALELLSAN
ncbi:MAG: TlpA family protein disulfide reductase [Flavobacteriales bacterium]